MKIFLDAANVKDIKRYKNDIEIKGFTTNPSLMAKSKINNYEIFAKLNSKIVYPKPISFEVISDDLNQMYLEAKKINSLGKNVYVKIPVINTKGVSTIKIIKKLCQEKIKLNITAIFTNQQINILYKNLIKFNNKIILSIFCGRIADTGIDPKIIVNKTISIFKRKKNINILWASTREVFNLYEAKKIKCNIITVTPDIFSKYKKFKNYNLELYSKNTVNSFYQDAQKSKLKILT